MLEINDKEKFAQIVSEAIIDAHNNCENTKIRDRWINAIGKATREIEENFWFMKWQPENKSLLIWSQGSDKIYSANGVCSCEAFKRGFPCFHRAAARLVRIYMESEEAAMPLPQTAKTAAAVSPNIVPTPPLSCNSHCYDLPNGVRTHVSWCDVHAEITRKKFNKKTRNANA